MDAVSNEVLITDEPQKMPEDVRALLDEHIPIPSNVTLFEERRSTGGVAKTWLLGGGLVLAGIVIGLFGMLIIHWDSQTPNRTGSVTWKPFVIGCVFIFAGVMVIRTIPRQLTLARAQQSGRITRYGIFLTPTQLVHRNEFQTVIIPRTAFRGVEGKAAKYEYKGETKSFNLPSEIVGKTVDDLLRAIRAWESKA
jgi:hypothetical protein